LYSSLRDQVIMRALSCREVIWESMSTLLIKSSSLFGNLQQQEDIRSVEMWALEVAQIFKSNDHITENIPQGIRNKKYQQSLKIKNEHFV
jgi:hypothetical protein